MDWHHRAALFATIFSAAWYIGVTTGHLFGTPGAWLGVMVLSGILFVFLPQEEQHRW